MGYEWSEDELNKVREDEFWKVRLNALFTEQGGFFEGSSEDQNSIVKVVGELVNGM